MITVRYYLSIMAAWFFNPCFLLWVIKQAGGQIVAALRTRSIVSDLPVSRVCFPLKGVWKVHRGGVTSSNSHSWYILAQRFAYDFVKEGEEGSDLASYPAFGEGVYAVMDGVVVELVSSCRDYTLPGRGWIDWRCAEPRGNYIVICHGDKQYSLYAHLALGSASVKLGQLVKQGERIAACGNSGHSTEPHLHFQMQDSKNFFLAMGLPVYFYDVSIVNTGESESESSFATKQYLATGQAVSTVDKSGIGCNELVPPVASIGIAEVGVGVFTLSAIGLMLYALMKILVGAANAFT